jgi:hypothetical protein
MHVSLVGPVAEDSRTENWPYIYRDHETYFMFIQLQFYEFII